MFEQATLTPAPLSTRLWSTCAGVTGQVAIVGSMILAPLLWPAVLPQVQSYVGLVAPGPPPPPPPPPSVTVRPRVVATREFHCSVCAPVTVPKQIAMIVEEDLPPAQASGPGVPGGVPGAPQGGVNDGLLGRILSAGTPPPAARPVETAPPPKPPEPAAIQRLRVGGNVKLAAPIRRVEPVYPQLARQARIEGVVQLEGVIGTDGRIHELKVLSGHPLLINAAVAAVKQWLYSPGTLNGDPVEVIAPITVTFRLGGN